MSPSQRVETVPRRTRQRRDARHVADPNFTFSELRSASRLHLFCDAHIGLLGAFADRPPVPDEFVPPILALGLLVYRHGFLLSILLGLLDNQSSAISSASFVRV